MAFKTSRTQPVTLPTASSSSILLMRCMHQSNQYALHTALWSSVTLSCVLPQCLQLLLEHMHAHSRACTSYFLWPDPNMYSLQLTSSHLMYVSTLAFPTTLYGITYLCTTGGRLYKGRGMRCFPYRTQSNSLAWYLIIALNNLYVH